MDTDKPGSRAEIVDRLSGAVNGPDLQDMVETMRSQGVPDGELLSAMQEVFHPSGGNGVKYSRDLLASKLDEWVANEVGHDLPKYTKGTAGVAPLPDAKVIQEVASEQQSATSVPDEETAQSYEIFKESLLGQFEAIRESGLKVRAWKGEGEPYKQNEANPWKPDSDLMRQRVEDEGEFWFFMTQKGFGGGEVTDSEAEIASHPLLQTSPVMTDDGEPMLWNDVFRVVHDAVAHIYGGYSFSTRGEFNGMLSHASTLPKEAWGALFAETFAQNSVYETTGKFAEQNVYMPKHLDIIEDGLKKLREVRKSMPQDGMSADSDFPLGAGRRRRRLGVPGSPESLSH